MNMDLVEQFQQQVQQAGASAAQGLQAQIPGLVDQASQQVRAQIPALQAAMTPAARDLGREAGAGAREGVGGLDTTTMVLGGVGAAAVLGLVVYAAVRAGSSRGGVNSVIEAVPASEVRGLRSQLRNQVQQQTAALKAHGVASPTGRFHGGQAASAARMKQDLSALLGERGGLFSLHAASRSDSASCRSKWGGFHADHEYAGELTVDAVEIDDDGYTMGKYPQYYGVGQPLYNVQSEDGEIDFFIRAADRADAKAEAKRCYPSARV